MTSFNRDYSAIKSQMKTIRKYLSQCSNPLEILDGIELYHAFENNIHIRKKERYPFSSKEQEIYESEVEKVICELEKQFQNERLFHQDFLATYRILSSFQREVEDGIPYLDNREYSILEEKEEDEILDSFFQEEDPKLKEIFYDMLRQKQIYQGKEEDYPSAIYNKLQKIPNIFIPKQSSTITKLTHIMHELGHIYDEVSLHQENSQPEVTYSYSYFSLYMEVFSYYYEQKFLYFLIGNDIYKEEAQNELLNQLDTLTDDLKRMRNTFSSFYDSYQVFSNIQYCYGPILASYIMDSDKEKQVFQTFRHEPFSSSKLEMIGCSGENAANVMMKKMKSYLTM